MTSNLTIVGLACRFPGASDVEAYWRVLEDGICAVSAVPPDRWSLARYYHPVRGKRGKSYTWAAGILPDAWGFDPAPFGISPREAEQMDPQQRLLLELTWEALEDAGIPPSRLAGESVGVFVGGSSTDHANFRTGDPAASDAHFATGNALSILANRISYAFDFRGPSLTVDTACSSSLVALHEAAEALRSGRIDIAIVGGVNILVSPYGFISFSQAGMLSPSGRCRTFSADADGYVRGEGGAVIVLQRADSDRQAFSPHGTLLATGVNSDGRTSGIALPSGEAQARLMTSVYTAAGISPDELAYIEAHGTGTPVGDPIEAGAIGRALGQRRKRPLLVGSSKTNIGHLEPAAGLAGLIKALLVLRHGIVPPSLGFAAPNPAIPFDVLNLQVASEAHTVDVSKTPCAGVNSFGFGGTNAHAIVSAPQPTSRPAPTAKTFSAPLLLSADSPPALRALAGLYAEALESAGEAQAAQIASAAALRRQRLPQRLAVVAGPAGDQAQALRAVAAEASPTGVFSATAPASPSPICFVYSGNGSQWPGMGQREYAAGGAFRAAFDAVDRLFTPLSGWSLAEQLTAADIAERLRLTSVAQPLIFAIQVAATAALKARGITPSVVLGHSVGEVAAAYAAGALDLTAAIHVIHARSTLQELAAGTGDMAVVLAPRDEALQLARDIPGLEPAAFNSPKAVAFAGPSAALSSLAERGSAQGLRVIPLDLAYPFHCALMAPVEHPLRVALDGLAARPTVLPMVSTVTGDIIQGSDLGPVYWWRNVRDPVQFSRALETVAVHGARYFLEIGPRGTLHRHIRDTLERTDGFAGADPVLSGTAPADTVDPFDAALARALALGAAIDESQVFAPATDERVLLPRYPWQHREYRFAPTEEAVGYATGPSHPLSGERFTGGGLEWHAVLDTAALPELADHVVSGQPILPGAGFVEIALSAGTQWLETDSIVVSEMEILKPLGLGHGETREILTRISPVSRSIEIFSRPRLSKADWLLHARAKLFAAAPEASVGPRQPGDGVRSSSATERFSADEIYAAAETSGLRYGETFRLLRSVETIAPDALHVELAPSRLRRDFLLDPTLLDAAFHGLFALFPSLGTAKRGVAYIPVRFQEVTWRGPAAQPCRAVITIRRKSPRSILADFDLLDANANMVARITGARFAAVAMSRPIALEQVALREIAVPIHVDGASAHALPVGPDEIAAMASSGQASDGEPTEAELMLEGWATAMAFEVASALASDRHEIDLDALGTEGRLTPSGRTWLDTLLRRLQAAGLAHDTGRGWRIEPESLMPESDAVLGALVQEQPARASELLLAAEIGAMVRHLSLERALTPELMARVASSARSFDMLVNHVDRIAAETASELLSRTLARRRSPLRILLIGAAALPAAATLQREGEIEFVVVEPREELAERARTLFPLKLDILADLSVAEAATFDIAVSAGGLASFGLAAFGGPKVLAAIGTALRPAGLLIAVEPVPTFFTEALASFHAASEAATVRGMPYGYATADQWTDALSSAAFEHPTAVPVCRDDTRLFVVAASAASLSIGHSGPVGELADGHPLSKAAPTVLCNEADPPPLAVTLASRWGREVMPFSGTSSPSLPSGESDLVVVLPTSADVGRRPAEELADRCLRLARLARSIAGSQARLWLVHQGRAAFDPLDAATWAFARTLTNEIPTLDVRLVDVAPGIATPNAADRLVALLTSETRETEILLAPDGTRALRHKALPRLDASASSPPSARLERTSRIGQRVAWTACPRMTPGPGEVEIAIEATGLNFRDLMWSMEMLPDDMLEDGFTGPTLGLECAGRVLSIGEGVATLAPGDRVMGLAPAAFSTHTVVDAQTITRVPDGMSFEAAATMPVAFLTAYYGLVTLADLRAGEWLLVHGGAGAVGLAAIQIAQHRQARIIATAGSPAKRSLLKAVGVEHVLDSRSTVFVDEVRAITGAGVDVVLNSLAGPAMERSMHCLRPFGRFVELGKRDYVDNTTIGLRPFRRNLSYFGVDVDQLMTGRPDLGAKVFGELFGLIREGELRPLPHAVLAAGHVAEAFQLMQKSAHVGKIVVRAPDLVSVEREVPPLTIAADRTHLVTGAFGGLGRETVAWLIANGARHLVLVGRRGAHDDAAKSDLAAWRAKGVSILAEPCDVSDERALRSLLDTARETMPPLAGVIHAAMVLDDGLVANLDTTQLTRVLQPKVQGADNLDRLTRAMPLDYFVMFSSVTVMIGNPGQAAYVAANGWMEGLARRRRSAGLPGLALAWGPITDVGIVARNAGLRANLIERQGMTGLTSAAALDFMRQAMARAHDDDRLGVLTVTPPDWNLKRARLPILASPTFSGLFGSDDTANDMETGIIDLRSLAGSKAPAELKSIVVGVIAARLAAVLHARTEDLDRAQPLSAMGLDSLMAFELTSSLEKALGIQLGLDAGSVSLTISGLADKLIAGIGAPADAQPRTAAQALLDKHFSEPVEIEVVPLDDVAPGKPMRPRTNRMQP